MTSNILQAKLGHHMNSLSTITIDEDDGWQILVFDWAALSEEDKAAFIEDVLGDAFQEAQGEAYVDGYDSWVSERFTPFALIGPAGGGGASLADFAQVDRVLFLATNGAVHEGGPDEVDIAGHVFADSIEALQLR